MKRPAFQFYPKDWQNNLKLRRCTEAARGVWIDLLCLMHESEEYGVLRFPLSDIAKMLRTDIRLLKQLADKSVLKGGDLDVSQFVHVPTHSGRRQPEVILLEASEGPMWYCSRFVKDEWLRSVRGASTRFGSQQTQPDNMPRQVNLTCHGNGTRQGDGAAVAFASALPTIKGSDSELALELAQPANPHPRIETHQSTPTAAAHSIAKAQAAIAESRKALETRTPPPPEILAQIRHKRPGSTWDDEDIPTPRP